MIEFETYPSTHKWSSFLGHVPIRVYITCLGDGYVDIGRLSHGALYCMRQVTNTHLSGCVLKIGDFCEFANSSQLLVAGEHGKNDIDRFTLTNSPVFRSVLLRGDFHGSSYSNGPITIGAGTIISAQAVVLSGTSIGAGCLIGAGSIVSSNIPERSIAVGVPAKAIKQNTISQETIFKLEMATLHEIAKTIYKLEVKKLNASYDPTKRLVVSVEKPMNLLDFKEVNFIGVQIKDQLIPIKHFPKMIEYSRQILKTEPGYQWAPNPLELDQL
jgi:acetyltransferase-like isoleucine patch superfamily enzyme